MQATTRNSVAAVIRAAVLAAAGLSAGVGAGCEGGGGPQVRDGAGRGVVASAAAPEAAEPAGVAAQPSAQAGLAPGVTHAPESVRMQERLQSLVFSTPEWRARAAEVARGKSPLGDDEPALGLACADDFEPAHCKLTDPACQLRCDAIRVCSNCAGGRWLTLALGPAKQTLYVEDDPSALGTDARRLPYGEWRNQFRTRAKREREPAYRALADAGQSFPDHHAKTGEFGYGKPTHTSTAPSAPVRSILKRGGFELVRVEYYGPLRFPVFVVTGKTALPRNEWRAWAAELVRAAGNRACELAAGTERYQFDRFATQDTLGGVYVFVEGAFHPWLPPEE